LEFNFLIQHKYGYIREKRSGVESYPYPVKEGKPQWNDNKTTRVVRHWYVTRGTLFVLPKPMSISLVGFYRSLYFQFGAISKNRCS